MNEKRKSTNARRLRQLAVMVGVGGLWASVAGVGCSSSSNGKGGVLKGIVVGDNGSPLEGVEVSTVDRSVTATTNAQGKYTLNVGAGGQRVVLNLSKAGYFTNVVGVTVSVKAATNQRTVLQERKQIGTVDNAKGGVIASDSKIIQMAFEPGALALEDGSEPSGPVSVFAAFMDPTATDFGARMPGGDFRANGGGLAAADAGVSIPPLPVIDASSDAGPPIDASSDAAQGVDASGVVDSGTGDDEGDDNGGDAGPSGDGVLTSFGVIYVEAQDTSGKPVTLKKPSDICLTIPQAMRSTAPATMPIWGLGRSNATWQQTTVAVRVDDQYCFQGTTMGAVNCDIFQRLSYIKGRVCNKNKPIANAEIEIANPNVNGSKLLVQTDESGEYMVAVGAGADLNATARLASGDAATASSATTLQESICALCPGETVTVDFGACPAVQGKDSGATNDVFGCRDSKCRDDSPFRSSANVCATQQVAGGDTPETRVIELGRSRGSFTFTHDAYGKKDQMRVFYEGRQLYDTGCISNGTTVTLNYSGTATSIVIVVTPNCDDPNTGTAWDFTIGCPPWLQVGGGPAPVGDGGVSDAGNPDGGI